MLWTCLTQKFQIEKSKKITITGYKNITCNKNKKNKLGFWILWDLQGSVNTFRNGSMSLIKEIICWAQISIKNFTFNDNKISGHLSKNYQTNFKISKKTL